MFCIFYWMGVWGLRPQRVQGRALPFPLALALKPQHRLVEDVLLDLGGSAGDA